MTSRKYNMFATAVWVLVVLILRANSGSYYSKKITNWRLNGLRFTWGDYHVILISNKIKSAYFGTNSLFTENEYKMLEHTFIYYHILKGTLTCKICISIFWKLVFPRLFWYQTSLKRGILYKLYQFEIWKKESQLQFWI